jgi:hypothetical protein
MCDPAIGLSNRHPVSGPSRALPLLLTCWVDTLQGCHLPLLFHQPGHRLAHWHVLAACMATAAATAESQQLARLDEAAS